MWDATSVTDAPSGTPEESLHDAPRFHWARADTTAFIARPIPQRQRRGNIQPKIDRASDLPWGTTVLVVMLGMTPLE